LPFSDAGFENSGQKKLAISLSSFSILFSTNRAGILTKTSESLCSS